MACSPIPACGVVSPLKKGGHIPSERSPNASANMSTTTKNGLARRQIAPMPVKEVITLPLRPSEDVGSPPEPDDVQSVLIWDEDDQAAGNYRRLGERLSQFNDLYRRPGYASGLLLLLEDGKHVLITKGADLAPVIVDRVPVLVLKGGKPKGSRINAAHLNTMLGTETFLGQADRTNAVAGALTAHLRNHFPGGKPVLLVTANKSQAGKDTLISFAAGTAGSISISYQATNWAVERNFVGALKSSPDVGVVVIENARLDRRDRFIASAFLERFATDPEPLLFSTGTGLPVRRRNDIVLAISTNFGSVSEDLMNRSLPIHLNQVGNVADRACPIGNPRHEYLPANRERIAAELRGMIERWKAAGQPLDEDVRHPFSVWAKLVGGILRVNGFRDFLGNYGVRKTVDDTLRQGLGLLGAQATDKWLQAAAWAKHVSDLGLVKAVIPPADQDSEAGRARGLGVVLKAHSGETFQTETKKLTLRLEWRRGRFQGSDAQVRYRFVLLEEEDLPLDAEH